MYIFCNTAFPFSSSFCFSSFSSSSFFYQFCFLIINIYDNDSIRRSLPGLLGQDQGASVRMLPMKLDKTVPSFSWAWNGNQYLVKFRITLMCNVEQYQFSPGSSTADWLGLSCYGLPQHEASTEKCLSLTGKVHRCLIISAYAELWYIARLILQLLCRRILYETDSRLTDQLLCIMHATNKPTKSPGLSVFTESAAAKRILTSSEACKVKCSL